MSETTPKRLCRAKSRHGPCKKPPMTGGFVCDRHGGRAPQVRRKAEQRMRDILADALDPDRSLREAGRIAFSDIRKLYDENGKLLPIHKWPDDIAACVASIETARGNVDKGDGQFDQVTRVKLWDKPRKLENLMKHHGQLVEKREETVNVNVVHRLMQGRRRVAELRAQDVVVGGQTDVINAEAKLLTDGRREG